jgi:hypothetical protein
MSAGFDPPTLAALRNFDATQCTEPEREAVVRLAPRTVAGSERWRPEQLILGTSRATQSEPTELQDALQVCKPHLNFLALIPRPLEALGASQRPGNVSGMLMDIARDLA